MSVMTTTEKAGYDSAVTKLAGISTGADVTSAALVTAGTTTADVAAAALAKICGYTQIAKGTLTLGTGAVLSLTDASFAGKTASGRGDLQGAAGVLGIVAGSFASSGAETGTGAGQAGLGSAAASGQPYNVSDFPGQNQFAQCVLLTSDRKPIPLVQMVAGSITDATAEVYGYLAFRSDLGADAKWRLRFYYRRSADGLEAPFTPTISLANCWLEVPENFLAPTLAPGFGLSQTTAGPAVSPIPTLDKVPAPVAAVAFASQQITGLSDGLLETDGVALGQIENPFNTIQLTDDFNGSVAGKYQWTSSASGTGAAATVTVTGQDTTHAGVIQISTGTTAPGRAAHVPGGNLQFTFGSGSAVRCEHLIQLPVLSTTGVQQYIYQVGLMDTVTGDQANGIYFEADIATDTHWRVCTASASTRTKTNTTVTIVAATWYRLTLLKAEGSTSWTFQIQGVDTGITNSTNLPTTALYPFDVIISSVGTTAKTALKDIVRHRQHFATPRG